MAKARQIRQHWNVLSILYYMLDAACIVAGFQIATKWLSPVDVFDTMMWAAVAVAGFFMLAEVVGTYRDWQGSAASREFGCVILNWLFTLIAALAAAAFLEREDILPGRIAVYWAVSTGLLLLLVRFVVRQGLELLHRRGFGTKKCAIVGVNELAFQLARNLRDAAGVGVQVAGLYDDREPERCPAIPSDVKQRLGDVDELLAKIQSGEIEFVYVTIPMRAEDRIKKILAKLADGTASVYIVPDFFVFELLHSRWTSISGLPAVSVFEHPFYGVDGIAKRCVDLVLAGLALAVAAFPMLVIAALVKLSSPGPIFFRQDRYGLDGKVFKVWKFRTMRVTENGADVRQAIQGDSRVTGIGAILRRTSLDELPQIFNVLMGQMSLVGPRPHANVHNEEYRRLIQGYMLRHKVKPGITGLAQVHGCRGETDTLDKMERRVEYDHRYIRDWSLWMDLKILLRTIYVVIKGENAY